MSPHHHRWHHSDEPAMAGRNFANMLAVFDVLGGTRAVRAQEPASFGIRDASVPQGFVGQMIEPFAWVARRPWSEARKYLGRARAAAARVG